MHRSVFYLALSIMVLGIGAHLFVVHKTYEISVYIADKMGDEEGIKPYLEVPWCGHPGCSEGK